MKIFLPEIEKLTILEYTQWHVSAQHRRFGREPIDALPLLLAEYIVSLREW
jgi:hypothetical protein